MTEKKVQIEEMLERMGASHEVPLDLTHCHSLRRTLLRSRYFENNRRISRWNIVFTYTAPLMTGTVVVGVFSFIALSLPFSDTPTVLSSSHDAQVVVESTEGSETAVVSVHSSVPTTAFVSDPAEPLVELAEFEQTALREPIRFVPVVPNGMTLVQ